MTYGHGISDELHRRLRGAVAPEALAWVEHETGSRVLAQRPLEGGTSAAIHRLVLDGRDDLVLQRLVLDWITEEPWAVSNEVAVLGLLADTDVRSPRVVAADPDGALAGVPTVLMTALPGPTQMAISSCPPTRHVRSSHGSRVRTTDDLPPKSAAPVAVLVPSGSSIRRRRSIPPRVT